MGQFYGCSNHIRDRAISRIVDESSVERIDGYLERWNAGEPSKLLKSYIAPCFIL
jgi:hypothetical protein